MTLDMTAVGMAEKLVDRHGADAGPLAMSAAREFAYRGNTEASAAWLQVSALVDQLLRSRTRRA